MAALRFAPTLWPFCINRACVADRAGPRNVREQHCTAPSFPCKERGIGTLLCPLQIWDKGLCAIALRPPLGVGGSCLVPQNVWSVGYQEGTNFKRFFFRMTKIKGVKNWYCSLEMKEKFGMRPLAATS